jgi:hypothetical protein
MIDIMTDSATDPMTNTTTVESKPNNSVEFENDVAIFLCPHCVQYTTVERAKIACGIFRHGVFIKTNEPINPHAPKDECDRLFEQKLIYGCGKPFKLTKTISNYIVELCPYI